MKTVVITDGKYRSSIAAARMLGRMGYSVVITQTRADENGTPPVFFSRYVTEGRWIDGSADDPNYPDRLLEVLNEYDHPVLLCVGATTLNSVAARQVDFISVCDFLIASPAVLDSLNDKEVVHRRCLELGIPVPRQFTDKPDAYPVIIKPHCGEKFGLKPAQRYAEAGREEEFYCLRKQMSQYDENPIVQEKILGDGEGVCLLLDRDGKLLAAICHRRIREYPVTGGPSSCCVSFYDSKMIEQAHALLKSFGFCGLGMVEFKGGRVLEVNPRIWGSFPLTEKSSSPIATLYAKAAAGECVEYIAQDYRVGVRMRFLLNDTAAVIGYLRQGKLSKALGVLPDLFRTKEALIAKDDMAPFYRYLRRNLKGK